MFAARRHSIGGFQRLLALKVILPHLARDRYFVDMFLDEARIASQIHHAHVVQVLDVVEHRGLPCIVMELLQGQSFAAARKVEGDALGLGLTLLVLAKVAEGLYAAHETCGEDGLPLSIVHRDVSPDNVHIGYDGHVKVVDFGIAAARGRSSKTRTGEVKGKLSYMAPELITAASDVDRKADVWSLGVMAWESLTKRRLFADESDAATMWNVVHREVPDLAEHAPELEPTIGAAIMACLRREPEARIDERELAGVLADAAREAGATPAALGEFMTRNFADRKARIEAKLERTLSSAVAVAPDTTPHTRDEEPATVPLVSTPEPMASPSRRRWIPLGVAAVVTAGLLGYAIAAGGGAHEPDRAVVPAGDGMTPAATVAPTVAPTVKPGLEPNPEPDPKPGLEPPVDDAVPSNVVVEEQSPPSEPGALEASNNAPVADPPGDPAEVARASAKKRRRPSARRSKKKSALMDSPY